jgi:hypothetical protein
MERCFIALHEKHIRQVDRVIQRRIVERRLLIVSLVDGIIEEHTVDPELSHLLQAELF